MKVLYLGGFNYYKGIDYLIQPIQQLNNVKFIISNFGDYKPQYIPYLKAISNVKLIPQVDINDMPKLYNSIDIVIVPSLSNPTGSERSPNVVIEALACGKPVIGTNVGGILSYVGDAGLIIHEKDSNAIVNAIKTLSDKDVYLMYSQRALKRAKEVFDINKYAETIIQLSKINNGGIKTCQDVNIESNIKSIEVRNTSEIKASTSL